MAYDTKYEIQDFGDMTLKAKAVQIDEDLTVTDDLVVSGDTTLSGILSVNLTNIPEYADQAAGAAALAAGRVFRVATTGALHVALT